MGMMAKKQTARKAKKPAPARTPKRLLGPRKEAACIELGDEVRALRTSLDEMLQVYQARVDGHLADLEQVFLANCRSGIEERVPTLQVMRTMKAALGDLALRPEKGRPKDFVRLEKKLRELIAQLPS